MLEINGFLVDEEVLTTQFECDYDVCHGHCCYGTIPGMRLTGCDLTAEEAAEIRSKRKDLVKYALKAARKIARRKPVHRGRWVYGAMHKGSCIYCNHGCALKRANKDGVLSFSNPLFCHLAPLDIENNVLKVIPLYRDGFCKGGFECGKRRNVWIIDSLKAAIIRAYSEDFWNALKDAQQRYFAEHYHPCNG